MPLLVECEICGKKYKLRDELVGKRIPCKECGSPLPVPGANSGLKGRPGAIKRGSARPRYDDESDDSDAPAFWMNPAYLAIAGGGALAILLLVMLWPSRPPVNVAESTTPRISTPNSDQSEGRVAVSGAPSTTRVSPAAKQPVEDELPTFDQQPGYGLRNVVAICTDQSSRNLFPQRESVDEYQVLKGDSSGDAFNWSVEPDPIARPLSIEPKRKIKVKVPASTSFFGKHATEEFITYPSVPSRFVAVGVNVAMKDVREVWDICEGRKTGTMTGLEADMKGGTLSPDGRYYSAHPTFSDRIGIYDFKEKKIARTIAAGRRWTMRMAFPSSERLLHFDSDGVEAYEVSTGESLYKLPVRWPIFDKVVISPGGQYMAVPPYPHWINSIQFYELKTGGKCGELTIPYYPITFGLTVEGLAFSHDGKEFAALVSGEQCSKILIWNVKTGELAEHLTFKEKFDRFSQEAAGKENVLAWFPGGQRLLINEHCVVDRNSQSIVAEVPPNAVKFSGKRWPVDEKRITVLDVEGTTGYVIPYEIPEFKKAAVVKPDESTRQKTIPAVQPTLKEPSLGQLKNSLVTQTSWKLEADPVSAAEYTGKAIQLEVDGARVRSFAVATQSPRAVVVRGIGDRSSVADSIPLELPDDLAPKSRPKMRNPFGPPTGSPSPMPDPTSPPRSVPNISSARRQPERNWLDAYDLTEGKRTFSIRLRRISEVLAVSPKGTRVLLRDSYDPGRIDVYSGDDGTPQFSWRPYSKGNVDMVGSAMIDEQSAVTLSSAGQLIVWDLENCTPKYMFERTCQPIVSPGGKYLGFAADRTLNFVEAATGVVVAQLSLKGQLRGIAFHPTGTKLAMTTSFGTDYYMQVIDLATGESAKPFEVPIITDKIHWCDDRYLLADDRLIDTKVGMVAWTYSGQETSHFPAIALGRHWMVHAKSDSSATLTPVSLPRGDAKDVLSQVKLVRKTYLERGSKCTMVFELSGVSESAQKAQINDLKQLVTSRGIKIEPDQAVVIRATLSVGNSPTVTLQSMSGKQTTQVTPKYGSGKITITAEGNEIWTYPVKVGQSVWMMLCLEGETPQSKLDAEFEGLVKSAFKDVPLPPKFFAPEAMYGVGKSEL